MTNNVIDAISEIENKETFVKFLRLLITDYRDSPESWENDNLPTFLEAAANWIEDMEGFYINNEKEIPKSISWKVFAEILCAAKIYE